MNLVALGGFCDPWITSIARDLALLKAIAIAAPRWGNNWREGDSRKITKKLPERFVVCGFSDGAPIALELAGWHPGCVGLIYTSGLARPLPEAPWYDFPALCMYTAGEKRSLAQGTTGVWRSLSDAGADATLRRASQPKADSRFKRRFPHFNGMGHHVEAIKQWMETTY